MSTNQNRNFIDWHEASVLKPNHQPFWLTSVLRRQSSRPTWSTNRLLGQPGLRRETLSQNTKNKQTTVINRHRRRVFKPMHLYMTNLQATACLMVKDLKCCPQGSALRCPFFHTRCYSYDEQARETDYRHRGQKGKIKLFLLVKNPEPTKKADPPKKLKAARSRSVSRGFRT